MTKQIVIEAFGAPDEVREEERRELLIYWKRGFFIGLNAGVVDTYGDLKEGRVERVPEPAGAGHERY